MFAGKRCAFTQKSSRNPLKAKMNFCQVYQPGKGKCLSENWSFRLSRYGDVAEKGTRYLSFMAYAEPPSASLQTEENTLIEQNMSVSCFFLSLLSPFGYITALYCFSFCSGYLMTIHFSAGL